MKTSRKHILISGFVRYFFIKVRDKILFELKRRWVLKIPFFALESDKIFLTFVLLSFTKK